MLSGLTIPQQVTHQGPPPALAGPGRRGGPTISGPGSETGKRIAESALKNVGLPYVWGGGDKNGPTVGIEGGNVLGLDCSGLVISSVYEATGYVMPRISQNQVNVGTSVDPGNLQPGDCVYFNNGRDFGHVAIAIGNNQIVEAPDRGQNVSVRTFDPYASNVVIKRIA
ncbi:cell wall-associated hydrolase, invasion-associated protein [Mycobacteroides abscessus subsp. abscessus]|nr:cell wall-associated hydrolase, invasion-associated protein [Mycobacteroides abscessus subsp. abscessus]